MSDSLTSVIASPALSSIESAAATIAGAQVNAPTTGKRKGSTPTTGKALAQSSGATIFAALVAYNADTFSPAASALLAATGGNVQRAMEMVGSNAKLRPYIARAGEIRSILAKTAPREFFADTFTNPAGVKIGDLHASTLGFSSLYRADNRAAMKIAREHARKLTPAK